MADMMDTLKGLLGDNAEDKIKSALGALNAAGISGSDSDRGSSDNESDNKPAPVPAQNQQFNAENLEYIMKIKNIADELSHPSDARSNLLMSLRPYMRGSRQKGIDNAVRILNLTKFSGLFR